MLFWIIRGLFLGVWVSLAAVLAVKLEPEVHPAITVAVILAMAGAAVAVDVLLPRKKVGIVSAVFFGLVVGLIISNLLLAAFQPLISSLEENLPATLRQNILAIRTLGTLVITSVLCYLCTSFLLQTKDDFRFIIPYVEFSKEMKGVRPFVLDTSVIIDGRIADLAETRMLDNALLVPGFVLNELQLVADSADKLKRNRGRRGLDVLNRLRTAPYVDLQTDETELPEFQTVRNVDQRLVLLAKHLNAKIVTNDFNLNKVARVQGIDVVNLNDVANALKPVFLPGETMLVRLTKLGDQPGQGIGYLDDGTMVVVEQGKNYIGEEVKIVVTSVLQTSAGRMIFGRLDGPGPGRS